jgi:hypothetical protein
MPVWVQIIVGALSLAREIAKLMREKEENKKEIPEKLAVLKDAVKSARKSGDTSEIENAFRSFGTK